MNLEVQIVATTPVFHVIKTAENRGFVGRGKRIRTSGPCLPKAGILASHVGFPLKMVGNAPHIKASVHDRITAEVQGSTLEHCLKIGPARRQPDRALPHEGRVRMAYRYCEDRIARQKQENFEKHIRQFHADADGVAPHHGYCYFIGEPDGDLVKIGYSKNPTHRLSQLRAEHSPDLRLLAKCFGGYTREGAYHAQFAHLRYKGEWFTVTDEIKAEIERLNSHQIDGVSGENRFAPYAPDLGKPGHGNALGRVIGENRL